MKNKLCYDGNKNIKERKNQNLKKQNKKNLFDILNSGEMIGKNLLYRGAKFFIKNFNKIVKPTTLGSRIIITKHNKILLLKHSDGNTWYLPGGGVNKGELPTEAIIREIKEEIGLDIKKTKLNIKPFGVYNNLYEGKNDYIFIFYLCLGKEDIENKGKSNNFEIDDFCFFSIDDLPKGISPGTQRRIYEFLDNSGDFIFKKW